MTGDTPGPAATAVIRQPVTDRDRRPLGMTARNPADLLGFCVLGWLPADVT